MDLFFDHFPIVIQALYSGFLQTLKLFFVTLIGALPLGLLISFGSMSRFRPLSVLSRLFVWVIRGTPLMIQLLIIYYFPGLVLGNAIWGGGETGRVLAAGTRVIVIY
ncbi:MAG: ABC transporter permease subunit, partial [Lachnospiraceae bacterium]|nr:ABC transporter permease subunit [Lachnospiraceae bacterium]